MTEPYWSVMVPTRNAHLPYLEDALGSVLQQDPGAGEMEIVVLEDRSSTSAATQRAVDRIGKGRVQFINTSRSQGIGEAWNSCIKRAAGKVLHILHQDDIVLPGFYDALRRGFESCSDVGAAFCRHAFIDDSCQRTGVSHQEREQPGVLQFLDRELAYRQLIHCPSIAVRRDVYEQIGAFRPDLKFVLDWEMWLRIAQRYPIWYEPEVLAAYRIHGGAETSRLAQVAEDIREVRCFLDEVRSRVPDLDPARLAESRAYHAVNAVIRAETLFRNRLFSGCLKQLFEAMRLSPSPPVLAQILRFGARVLSSAGRKLAPSRQ